ncbi:MAG: hypothetical protein AB8Y59_03690, partial [Coxiella endosymbiont of Haemaphysalis qinghaiensis]
NNLISLQKKKWRIVTHSLLVRLYFIKLLPVHHLSLIKAADIEILICDGLSDLIVHTTTSCIEKN